MFADSLLESARHRPSGRRSLSLLTSVAIEALAVAVLVAIPIWHPDVMAAVGPHVVYPAPVTDYVGPTDAAHHAGGGGGPAHGARSDSPVVRNFSHNGVYFGKPVENSTVGDPTLPPGPSVGSGDAVNLFPNGTPLPPPLAKKPPLIVSHYDPGSIIRQVTPEYPDMARRAHVQGEVVLQAIVTRAGTIERLTVVSGNPLLVPAARDAVRQWRFRPYMLNGQAVEIETMITVNFRLDGGGGAL